MAIKEIVKYPNDILTTPTKEIDLETAQKTAVDLFAVIYNTKIRTVAEGSSIWYTIKDE